MFLGFSTGLLSDLISDVWLVLADAHKLATLGFASTQQYKPTDLKHEQSVAHHMLEAAISVTADIALYEFEWTHSIYGFAPRLTHHTGAALEEDHSISLKVILLE